MNIRFLQKGNAVGEIYLYDEVGDGFFTGMGAKTFQQELTKLGRVDAINLHINSPGGSVFDGVTIYNLLAQHPARINVSVDGIAASIAAVIAMAGDEINMADNAMMMIHNTHTVAVGGAEDLRKTADLLETLNGVTAQTFATRSGQTLAAVHKIMDDETWLTAAQARELGFADNVTESMPIAACLNGNAARMFRAVPTRLAFTIGQRVARDMVATMHKRTSG